MTVGEALKAGWGHTLSRWPGTLLVAAAGLAEALAGVMLALAVFAGAAQGGRVMVAGLGGALVAGLLSRLLQFGALAGSVRSGSRWFAGRPEEGPFEAIWAASPRAGAFFAFSLPIDAAFFLWKWLGLGALLVAFGRVLSTGRGAFATAVAISLYVALTGLLLGLDVVWRKAALVRAVVHDRGVGRSLLEALTLVGERPFARAAAVSVPFGFALMLVLFFNVMAGTITQAAGSPSIELQLASQLASALPSAFVIAVAELVALQGLSGLDLPPATGV